MLPRRGIRQLLIEVIENNLKTKSLSLPVILKLFIFFRYQSIYVAKPHLYSQFVKPVLCTCRWILAIRKISVILSAYNLDISNRYVKWDELICDLTSKEIPRLRCETYIDNKVTDGAVKRNQVSRWDQQLPWKYALICKDQATIGPILTTLIQYQPCCGTLWDVYWDEVDTSNLAKIPANKIGCLHVFTAVKYVKRPDSTACKSNDCVATQKFHSFESSRKERFWNVLFHNQ